MPEVFERVGLLRIERDAVLVQVMPARSSACSASRPVSGKRPQVDEEKEWVSVPPETIASPPQ